MRGGVRWADLQTDRQSKRETAYACLLARASVCTCVCVFACVDLCV